MCRSGHQRLLIRFKAAFAASQKNRIVIWRCRQEIDHSAQRIHTVKCRSCAFQHLDRIHRLQRNWQIEVVVRSLGSVVDAKSVQQHKRLLKAPATQHQVRFVLHPHPAPREKPTNPRAKDPEATLRPAIVLFTGRISTDLCDSASGTGVAVPSTTKVSGLPLDGRRRRSHIILRESRSRPSRQHQEQHTAAKMNNLQPAH